MTTTLVDAGLKGLVLLAAIALVALAMRRASAARRHLVWTLAVIGLLVLPVLSAALPAWRVTMLPAWLAESAAESRVPVLNTKVEPAPAQRAIAEAPPAVEWPPAPIAQRA
ncbi:MAG TPA: hypothetical protein VFV87_02185, partial [Pirellulaceae bacterium]|nr:hypothetical protein [Pirellulaceae bacterium]